MASSLHDDDEDRWTESEWSGSGVAERTLPREKPDDVADDEWVLSRDFPGLRSWLLGDGYADVHVVRHVTETGRGASGASLGSPASAASLHSSPSKRRTTRRAKARVHDRLMDPALMSSSVDDIRLLADFRASVMHKYAREGGSSTLLRDSESSVKLPPLGKAAGSGGGAGAGKMRPPWRPSNARSAKEALERGGAASSLREPYVDERTRRMEERAEAAKKFVGPPFRPSGSSSARSHLQKDTYFNSPDRAALDAEAQFLKERAKKNTAMLKKKMADVKERRARRSRK
eukprot:PLAT7434.1.p1 GENE.PLAT7434.1~~PLAT7434.1.p1  ORF type:complete len:288 (+),score=76.55 PLAT7434.1:60-923(+)